MFASEVAAAGELDAGGRPVGMVDDGALGEFGLLHTRDLNRAVAQLSAGQRRRLALAIVIARRPDPLLLDEPTNHISLTLASELEAAFRNAPATILVASHDRWLRQRWPDERLDIDRPDRRTG